MKVSTKLTFLLFAPVLYACQRLIWLVSNIVFQTSASVVPKRTRATDSQSREPQITREVASEVPIVDVAAQNGQSLDAVEKAYILSVLENSEGNRTRTAEILGIGRRTLYRKLSEYGVES